MKKQLFSLMALLLMVAGSAMAQNENSVNVRELTKNAQGNWVLNSMPGWNGVLEITLREAYRLDSIPLAWTIMVNGVDSSAQVTAYTAEEGPDTLGWLNVLEGDTVELVPPTVVKPTVKSVTLVDNSVSYTMAKDATAADKGKLICAHGHIHANGEDAECTAARVAKIIYLGTTGHATYTHGLALALTDEGQMAWDAAKTACNTTKNTSTPVTDATWLLASKDQWDYMLGASGAGSYTALRDGFSSITGASNLVSVFYWSSTEKDASTAWRYWFYEGNWNDAVTKDHALTYVRACLAF